MLFLFVPAALREAHCPRTGGAWRAVRGLCFKLFMVISLCVLTSCAPPLFIHPSVPIVLVTLDPNSTATATPFQPGLAADTAIPTSTAAGISVVQTDTPAPAVDATSTDSPPEPTATTAPPPADPATVPAPTSVPSDGSRTHYTFYVTLDYAKKAVAVNESVRYVNTTGQSLSSVVFAVEPNLWANCFSLSTLAQDDSQLTDFNLSGQRLTVNPAQPIAPGAVTTFSLGYSLSLPYKASDGTFGYLASQLNLTDWYPFIVPFSGDWVLHDTWPFGEELVYDPADYDVNVSLNDSTVILAASAPAEQNGNTTHYHLEAARTFALSASDSFKVDESAVGTVKIRSYYFSGDGNASQAVVWMATQSLGLYQAKFAPYPYQSLSIVETDVPDGQEFDGLVFLGTKFYSDYNGSAKSNLITIGTHEIAHQWWFGLVGNDQATEPWLDEAMAVYSERLFYEYNYPNYGDWWWNFRVNYFGPTGYVDSSVYSFGTFHAYVGAVYLNGANFLDDLRTRIGDEAFLAFIKDYAASFSHGHATTAGFFSVLRQHTDKDFSDIMRTYFQGQY